MGWERGQKSRLEQEEGQQKEEIEGRQKGTTKTMGNL